MGLRISIVVFTMLFSLSCSGVDKHLPSSNPPEYDPKKAAITTAAPPSAPATVAKPSEPGPPPIQLPPLEPGQNEKGEWRKVPVKPESLQLFNGVKSPCEALSKIVQGLGSAQLFAGAEGAALKKSLGSQADSTAQILDEQLAELIKQALGPAAANCPTPSAKLRKTSGFKDLSQPASIVLTNSSSSHPLLLAQATPSQGPGNGYTVTTTRHKQDAPPGWVGAKTTDQTTRVGNKPETAGNRSSLVLVLGGKVLKCPTHEGVVAGDFEYAVVLNEALADRGVMRVVHIGLHAAATLKGHVGDDAQIQYIEGDLTTVAERGGTDVPTSVRRRRSQFRFVPSRDEFYPGFPTNITGISATGWDIQGASQQEDGFAGDAAGAVMFWGGQTYLDAQREWHKPNTCVEITFKPATKAHKLGPNESVPVKTELRTKREQALVPAKFEKASERPRERNGTVSPREDKSHAGQPATFTYKAPATRVRHSGFWVGAISRAGVAEAKDGEWEVVMDPAYVLEFQSRIISTEPTEPVESVAAAKIVLTPVEGKEGWYRGSGTLGYQTGPPPNRDPCSNLVMGHGMTRFDVAGMSITLSEKTDNTGQQTGSADIELHYLIHPTTETVRPWTMVDYKCVPGKELPDPFFFSMYAVARGADEVNRLTGWTYVGQNGVVAKKVLRGNCGDYCQDETVFMLKEAEAQASPPK